MSRHLALSLLLLAPIILGCSSRESIPIAPHQSAAGRLIGHSWTDEAGNTWTWLDNVHLQKVDIGKIEVVYICDYPLGYYGPPAPGHCYTDGTGCVDPF